MLFASLISTYLIYKGRSVVGPFPHEAWTNPPTGADRSTAILDIPVTSASTFVLLMSSLCDGARARRGARTRTLPKRTRGERILGSSKLWLLDDGDRSARRSSASRRTSSRRSCTKG